MSVFGKRWFAPGCLGLARVGSGSLHVCEQSAPVLRGFVSQPVKCSSNSTLISKILDVQLSAVYLEPLVTGPRAGAQIHHQSMTGLGLMDNSTKERAGGSLGPQQVGWGGGTMLMEQC